MDSNHWAGALSSSALATAISIVALQARDPEGCKDAIARGRGWLLETQHPDGGWGDAVVDASNINSTSLALAALVFTSPGSFQPARADGRLEDVLERARARLLAMGGYEAVGDPKRCTLSGPCRTVSALAELMSWTRIKRLRPEVILFPRRLTRTISTTFPAYLSIATLHSTRASDPRNLLPTYPLARRRAMAWLSRAQGPGGSFELSAFLTALIIVCLSAAGLGDLPWLRPAFRFVLESQRPDGGWPIDRDLETFDTDLAVMAFRESGLTPPNATAVRDWLVRRQIDSPCFPSGAPPGGWAWAMPDGWPDSDDTSFTLLALRSLGVKHDAPAIVRGSGWLEGMQNRDGSWSTFVRNSRMPFDHDCPYITGHVLRALNAAGRFQGGSRALDRGLAYLERAQRADGSFASIWFRASTAGSASVAEALSDCGLAAHRITCGARGFLLRNQNPDGGWGGELSRDASTVEETSWALLALLRGPLDECRDSIQRGLDWLCRNQRADGTWSPWPVGLYYSAMWYSDSAYALTLPLTALGRARRVLSGER